MDMLKKYFPLSFREKKDIVALVINIIIYLVVGVIAGFVIGLLVAIVRTIEIPRGMSPVKKALRKLAHMLIAVYIQVFRGTPMIVQAMVI